VAQVGIEEFATSNLTADQGNRLFATRIASGGETLDISGIIVQQCGWECDGHSVSQTFESN
jgi:hypothetical protein